MLEAELDAPAGEFAGHYAHRSGVPGSYPVCVSFAVIHIYGFVIVTAAVNPRLSSVKMMINLIVEKLINLPEQYPPNEFWS